MVSLAKKKSSSDARSHAGVATEEFRLDKSMSALAMMRQCKSIADDKPVSPDLPSHEG
jgi:hypothetical protein